VEIDIGQFTIQTSRRTKNNQLTLYRPQDGSVQLEVKLEKGIIWLTQKQMANLFQTESSVVTKHLRNVFSTGELDKDSAIATL
jgi:hypothetical protein